MAVLTKLQLKTNINADPTYTTAQKSALNDLIDSYEDIFANVTTAQRDAITSPSSGLIVYNIDTDRFEYWNGTAWFAIGQNVYTPIVAPFSLASADILALNSTPYVLAAAPGAGFAIVPISITYVFTPGGTPYSGSYSVELKAESNVLYSLTAFTSIGSAVINSSTRKSGGLPTNTGTGTDAIVEDDAIVLYATAAPTLGNGTLTGVLTYSLIPV